MRASADDSMRGGHLKVPLDRRQRHIDDAEIELQHRRRVPFGASAPPLASVIVGDKAGACNDDCSRGALDPGAVDN